MASSRTTSVFCRFYFLFMLFPGFAMVSPALSSKNAHPENPVDQDHFLSMEFETPHTKWAKPYTHGPIKVLFLTDWYQNSTHTREIIELMQRFEIQAEAVYYHRDYKHLLGDDRPERFGDEKAGSKRLLRLLERPFDVYFFSQIGTQGLPREATSKLLGAVSEGAGLIVVGERDSTLFSAAVPTAAPTAMASGQFFVLGKGRAGLLPPRRQLEFQVGWETAFDYQMAAQGRALLWAAGRSPSPNLELALNPSELRREALPLEAISAAWGETAPGTQLRLELRRWDGKRTRLQTIAAAPQGAATFGIPQLRAGAYHLDAFLEGSRGISNWATLPFQITSDLQVEAVELDSDWAEVGGTIAGGIGLAGSLQNNNQIQLRLLDMAGRILLVHNLENDKNGLRFRLPVAPWMPMLLRVEALVLEGEEEVSSAHAFFHITKRQRNRYHFLMWDYPRTDLAPYVAQSLAKEGVTLILGSIAQALPSLAAQQISLVPYTTRICPSHHSVAAMLDSTGELRTGCYHAPEKIDPYIRATVERQVGPRRHGVFAYSLGDENAVRASCLSPQCMQAYQRYLAKVYGDIDSLNRSWGTAFETFERVALSPPQTLPGPEAPDWFRDFYALRLHKEGTDDHIKSAGQIDMGAINDEMPALQAGNFPRWYDRQAFQLHTYVELCKRFRNAFKELDPEARTGFEGAGTFAPQRLSTRTRKGGDLDLFVRELDYWGPYPGATNEVIRSIAQPGFPGGNWLGYSMEADMLLKKFWDQITNHMNLVQWWRWDLVEEYHGFLTPSLDVFPATREMLEDTRIVRDGLASLLMHYQMYDDGIAILHSLPSSHIAHFDGNLSYGRYERDHGRWHQLIHDAGLQFRYTTDRMLRLGEFELADYKILILPLSYALGHSEAEYIEEFVRQGGTLIADVRPGIYDGHCKPQKRGLLDDVFGIKRHGKRSSVEIEKLVFAGELEGHSISMKWRSGWHEEGYRPLRIDPTVELASAHNLGRAFPYRLSWPGFHFPAGIVNHFGKGRAVLLNFGVFDAPIDGVVKQLLRAAGATPTIHVTRPAGKEIPGLEITRWHNREIELVALYGSAGGPARVQLPEKRFVYELKSGQDRGWVQEFSTTLRPYRASFFALLPTAALPPEIGLKEKIARRGSQVEISLSLPGAAGLHALRLHLTTPTGERAAWFAQQLIVDQKPQEVVLPFAHNDPPGQWSIYATDLFTSRTTIAKLVLK